MNYDEHSKAIELGVDIVDSKLRYLQRCDELCKECILLKDDIMLCEGVRPFVSTEDSIRTNSLKLFFKPCHKRLLLEKNSLMENRIKASWIPEKAIRPIDRNKLKHYSSLGLKRNNLGHLFTERNFIEVLSAITSGITARYVYMPALMAGYANWVEALNEDLVEYPTLLIVDCIDLAVGPRIRRDAVIACIEQRAALGMDTVIGMSENPVSKDPREQRFYQEVLLWQKLI